jgi:glycosyltransferase involved in cell wall biosynthesis
MVKNYIAKDQRKKILLLCDDIRMTSGISTIARELVIGTSMHFNWVNIGGAIQHPDKGKRFDLSHDTNNQLGINDSSVFLYPTDGYGSPELVRHIMEIEKPDAIMIFTDPRYWVWLFQIENEIRKKVPLIYLNIWDDYPAPLYNSPYYESCDALFAISKQTLNINKLVLGDKAKNKVLKYIPHGINENLFFNITSDKADYARLQEFKKTIFGDKEYDFILFYNSRNIRRKNTSDTLAAFKVFLDTLPKDKADKCAFLLHTQPVDENGTDLPAVIDLLFGEDQSNIFFSPNRIATQDMNILYNLCDATILLSSNEGWGLSLTESMMAERPIIATVTGGMQDQMRFENEKGEWVDFDENFCSNHFGTYKKHGKWAYPVFPSCMSIQGSIPTPYIFDDRVDFRDAAAQIKKAYTHKTENPFLYKKISKAARKWATSDESMMSSRLMSENIIEGIEETFNTWKPRNSFELIKIEPIKPKQLRHKLVY